MANWKKIITSGSAAELSSLTLDTALPVTQGGIGATSLTDKAVLISQDSGTDAIGAVALTSNGQIIIGGSDGPAAATIGGTSNEVEVTNGANSITIGLPDNVTIGGGLTVTNDITLTNSATDIDLIDNNSSALSFDASGKAGILEIDTTNSSEQVKMSGNLDVTGIISGSTISGSFVGDGSNLTGVAQDIDTLTELDATPHATQDEFLISDNGTEKRISMTNVAKGVFAIADDGDDATIAADGGITINNDAVDNNKLANIARGSVKVGGGSNAPTDLDAKTDGQILVGDGTDINSVAVSGDVALANNGAVTIQANAVEGSMLNSNVAGSGLDYGSNELSVDVSDFMANGSNNRIITATGTDGQNAEANLTFDGSTLSVTGDATISGDLTINGTTTTVATTNTEVADQFLFLASGSAASNVDAGIIVQSGSAHNSGSAFYHDKSDQRWSVAKQMGKANTGAGNSPTQFVTTVKTDTVNPDTTSGSYGVGEMHVNTSTGEIWIRFG